MSIQPSVTLRHDEEAGVWYVDASNVPGLHAEAAIVADVMPDSLKANGILKDAGLTKAF